MIGDVDYSKIITTRPEQRFGQPCIRGMRISVFDVLDWLGAGQSVEEILDEFPELTREDIQASIAYAADKLRPRPEAAVGRP